VHATHVRSEVRQRLVAGVEAQSASAPQPGRTHVLFVHTCPAAHWVLAVHATQAPLAAQRPSAAFTPAHSASSTQPRGTHAFWSQRCSDPHWPSMRHATHVRSLVRHRGVAPPQSASDAQPPEAATQRPCAHFWPGQSPSAAHSTQTWSFERQTFAGALQSAGARQPFGAPQVLSDRHLSPPGHWPGPVHATQTPSATRQRWPAGFDLQSLSEWHFGSTGAFSHVCDAPQTFVPSAEHWRLSVHDTHRPDVESQCGVSVCRKQSLSTPQRAGGATQVWLGPQVSVAGQSRFCRQATQRLVDVSQTRAPALPAQSAVVRQRPASVTQTWFAEQPRTASPQSPSPTHATHVCSVGWQNGACAADTQSDAWAQSLPLVSARQVPSTHASPAPQSSFDAQVTEQQPESHFFDGQSAATAHATRPTPHVDSMGAAVHCPPTQASPAGQSAE
jgi:hypothetical protein